MRFFALNLLLVGIAAIEGRHHSNFHFEGSLFDSRSAPGVVQPNFENKVNSDDAEAFFQDDGYSLPQESLPEPVQHFVPSHEQHYVPESKPEQYYVPEIIKPEEYYVPDIKQEEYGVPEIKHDEYGLPEVKHEEYGPPLERIQPVVTTEHYCPEEDFKSEFLRVPPAAPEINPLHEEYGVPKIHEEYGPPPKLPLCPNGALDSSYPFCCENGAVNPYCCLGEWINPSCSEPTTTTPAPLCPNGAPDYSYPFCCENGATNSFCCVGKWINPSCSEPTTPAPKLAPYPPKKLCLNYADDSTYPYCCENGAVNEYCCLGRWINPTCSEPTTTTPAPLCPNGASDLSYPFCCENGAVNPYCCVGEWINPTCSEPTTPAPKIAPYPPKKLCSNYADDSTYPFCCANGALNEYCCLGEWVNPTCTEPTTPAPKIAPYPPKKLCSNYAVDSTYPYCCENGAVNEYCCLGEWVNPTCSAPTTTTPAPLCPNGAPDTSYPFCCENGAVNPYCCVGRWINPTCSEPTTTPAPRIAPYPAKSPYPGKVESHYSKGVGVSFAGSNSNVGVRVEAAAQPEVFSYARVGANAGSKSVVASKVHSIRYIHLPVISVQKRFVRHHPLKSVLKKVKKIFG